MSHLSKKFVAAISRSLRRGKSLLQAILDFFSSRDSSSTPPQMVETLQTSSAGSTQNGLYHGNSNNPADLVETSSSSTAVADDAYDQLKLGSSLEDFLLEVEREFLDRVNDDALRHIATGFQQQFMEALQATGISMLPSYNSRLPSGDESGRFLAVDMGGSNLRVAIIQLQRPPASECGPKLLAIQTFSVTEEIRSLVGLDFFKWMASRIRDTISSVGMTSGEVSQPTMSLSLAWSFPIDQTSVGDGRLLDMGKGMKAGQGLTGKMIGDVISEACASVGLDVKLKVILNDSTACLLSQAYTHLSTRMGLILGTGTNIAAFLPVGAVGQQKFGVRDQSWWDDAHQVVVNTEVSTMGKDILPLTRWDSILKKNHERPDFQPLEQMVSGMYLGEICRLVLIEAVENHGLFGGVLPPSLETAYSLGTATLAGIESDESDSLSEATKLWQAQHPSKNAPLPTEMYVVKSICSVVAKRSSALVASAVYALWDLRSSLSKKHAPSFAATDKRRHGLLAESTLAETSVAFNGSVIEKYPGYLSSCSIILDRLVAHKNADAKVNLVMAHESSLFGAAIALACEEN